MAQTYSFRSATTMKLMLLAMVSVGALAEEAGRGRFLASFDDAAPISTSRRLLINGKPINTCGADQCQSLLNFGWKKPTCCTDTLGNSACWDTGAFFWDKCGSCTKKCVSPQICCKGVCADLKSDSNNCGFCGKGCTRGERCVNFFCNYNGKSF